MKRLLSFTIAFVIASVAFGQRDYKHPFSKKNVKENSETFPSVRVKEQQDYKHPGKTITTTRVHVRQGKGANPAATSKHPFGLGKVL